MKKKTWRSILKYASITAITICFVFPIYWMLLTSIKPNEAILKLPPQFVPVTATMDNYRGIIGIQKLQQSYVTDNINEELSAALTKLTETEYQVKTATETMNLANENLDLVSFSYNEGKANMVDVLSAQLSWTQAHTNLINAYLSEKMAIAEYRRVISE